MMTYLVALLIAYAAILLVLRLFEPRMIFFPYIPGRLSGDWNPPGLKKEDVWIRTSDGVKLHAWWIPVAGAEFTVIAFHGNAGNVPMRADTYEVLHALPASVLAVEYRGYGKSEGTPSEQGMYLDALAAYDYVARNAAAALATRVIVFGQSLGTVPAAYLAAERDVRGIILEAPFPSAREVAKWAYPFLPGIAGVMRSRMETSRYLEKSKAPLLVVHCERDPVMPFAMGERVFRDAREPKWFFRVPGECHEEASLVAPEEYRARLREFLQQVRQQ